MTDPFVYIYSVGGLVFLAGLIIGAKQGYFAPTGAGLIRLLACLGIAAFFFALQGYLQYAPMSVAPATPYNGGADELINQTDRVRGAPIDYAIVIGYFVAILAIGTWFSRKQKTVKDFFFGGQKFHWWLISFSLVATTVGSYSFVKYSSKGFEYGLSSSQTYLNDWIWFPLLIFGWLPILYFSRVTSIPEYFGRRFNSTVRFWATACILLYLVGYIGVNLFTMGKVLNALVGWPILPSAMLLAGVSAIYVTAGGQTSVIMTDLFQGVMLLATGLLIIVLAAMHMGGFEELWANLPRDHRKAFPNFNEDPDFPSVGIFWQDAMANTAMFYFLNQGIIMRFLSARSVNDSRKAAGATILVLMTIGACVVGAGGWVAAAMVNHGDLPQDIPPDKAFYVATEFLSRPGMFGLILAALTAALMSTVDTLITAVAAITVNDIYKPYIRPAATEKQTLNIARWTSVAVALIGVILVPVFMQFKSVYDAHGAFTAAVTPPLVVTLLMSVFWRRFTATAALCTIVGGLFAISLSILFPQIINPFAHGVPLKDVDSDSVLAGMKQYKYMRACFGLAVCTAIGLVVTAFTRPESTQRQRGLVWGTVAAALENYKGSPGDEFALKTTTAHITVTEHIEQADTDANHECVHISRDLAETLGASVGDLLYISDRRKWLGGLKSTHVLITRIVEPTDKPAVYLTAAIRDMIASTRTQGLPIRVEKLY